MPGSSTSATPTAAAASCSIAPRSIRPPAASRSTPARLAAPAWSTSSSGDDGAIVHVVEGEARRSPAQLRAGGSDSGSSPAASTGRGASITCSSTPASTCCRRRSIASAACAPRASISAPTTATIDLARELTLAEIAGAGRRANDGGLGGSTGHDPVRRRRGGGRRCNLRKESSAHRHAAHHRRRGLRRVGLRRHARRAGPARSASSRCRAGNGFAAARGWSSDAASARCSATGCCATPSRRQPAAVDVPRRICRRAIERLQQDGKRSAAPGQGCSRAAWPAFEADAVAAHAGDCRRSALVVEAVPGRRHERDQDDGAERRLAARPRRRAADRRVCPRRSSWRGAANVPVDAARVLKQLIAHFGGKGGGRPELAQGGGLDRVRTRASRSREALLSASLGERRAESP